MDGQKKPSFLQTLAVYFQIPMLIVFGLGIASGFPLLLTGSTLSARMMESGVDIKLIGIFALMGLPYTFKFLWSPLVDAVKLSPIHVVSRRRWLWLTQVALAACLVGMSITDPVDNLEILGIFALLTAFFSATQDIVIDALRVEILKKEDQGAASAMSVAGYRVGMLLAGAGAFILATYLPWDTVYNAAAAIMLSCTLIGLSIRKLAGYDEAKRVEAEKQNEKENVNALENNSNEAKKKTVSYYLFQTFIAPLVDFFKRHGASSALCILLFIVLFKLGDAMASSLLTPFYLDIGYTKPEIAAVSKVFGFVAVLLGSFLGGLVVKRFSMVKALLICGMLQLASNFVFVWLSFVGHNMPALVVAIGVENITGGMGTAAFVAFMASLCNVEFTATQYALFSALSSVGRTIVSSSSGFIVAGLGWAGFYCTTALFAIPGLVLLWLLKPVFDKQVSRKQQLALAETSEQDLPDNPIDERIEEIDNDATSSEESVKTLKDE